MTGSPSRSSSCLAMDVLEVNYIQLEDHKHELKHKYKRESEINHQVCEEKLRIITLDQLSRHDGHDDCWIAIYDCVYDCTEFIDQHPGGRDIILEYAGRDATIAFVGAGHTNVATGILKKYIIGQLPAHERLFVVSDGVKIVMRSG